MKSGPSIAPVAALAGDPARANMLSALLGGKALTAGELAREAGVGLSTASAHLARLEQGGLIAGTKQGRHRYYRLAGSDVATMLESLMGVAARAGHMRQRTGPTEPAMRRARVCYDHLAGEMGVALWDGLVRRKFLSTRKGEPAMTQTGRLQLERLGIDIATLVQARRPLCRSCLDWSERRSHLAGGLGAALLGYILTQQWARRAHESRTLIFSPAGEKQFRRLFC